MGRLGIVLAGGFGGSAPSLIELAKILQNGGLRQALADEPNYWIPVALTCAGLGVFFLIGACVALIYNETVLSKAMLLGIGAPALIMATAATQGQEPRKVDLTATPVIDWFLGPAFAQDTANAPNSIVLNISPSMSLGDCRDCKVEVLDSDRRLLTSEPLNGTQDGRVNGDTSVALEVPEGANAIVLSGTNTNPVLIEVKQLAEEAPAQGAEQLRIDVTRDRNYWNDVMRTLGNRSVQPFDFGVSLEK